nr:MAG TPA: hypothetical protein [Bacteriophage sp.]
MCEYNILPVLLQMICSKKHINACIYIIKNTLRVSQQAGQI